MGVTVGVTTLENRIRSAVFEPTVPGDVKVASGTLNPFVKVRILARQPIITDSPGRLGRLCLTITLLSSWVQYGSNAPRLGPKALV